MSPLLTLYSKELMIREETHTLLGPNLLYKY